MLPQPPHLPPLSPPLPSLPLFKGVDPIPLLSHSSSRKIPLPQSVFEEHLNQLDPSSSYPSLEHKMCLAKLITKVLATPLLSDTASRRQGTGHVRVLVN